MDELIDENQRIDDDEFITAPTKGLLEEYNEVVMEPVIGIG